MTKYTLKPTIKHTYHRVSSLSKTEIMLIKILFHDSGYLCLKHSHQEKTCKYMRHFFPKVVSHNRFTDPEKEIKPNCSHENHPAKNTLHPESRASDGL